MGELTKRTVEAPPVQATDSVNWDDEIPGFGIRFCASGRRSYIIQFRDQGRSRRFTIGGHGIWTPELARREAKVQLGRVARSDDPAEEQQLDDQAMPVKKPSQRYLADVERGPILGKRVSSGSKAIPTLPTYQPAMSSARTSPCVCPCGASPG